MDVCRVAFSVTELRTNQYISLLCSALQQEGVTVSKINWKDVLQKRVQAIHVHWPEHFLRPLTKLSHIKLLSGFLCKLVVARIIGIPVIWTVHNTWPHDSKVNKRILKCYLALWVRMVNACIYMSPSTRFENEQVHPAIKGKPYAIIPHGHYKDIISASITKGSARRELGLDDDATVLSHCGIIRSYKNTRKLVDFFSAIPGDDLCLLIAGKCSDKQLLKELQHSAAKDSRIKFMNRLLPEAEITAITAASDLVVLPYTKVANSGVAFYALSIGRPVLGPRLGAFRDLHDQFGDWIRLYDGDFKSADLEDAINWIRSRPELPVLDLSDSDWQSIAKRTKQFYEAEAMRIAG